MAISTSVEWADVSDLILDPKNPRLGRRFISSNPSQEDILDWMSHDGVLEELAVSFLESGFWTQEAVVVVEERIRRKNELVVVEGNRRLAALKMLWNAWNSESVPRKWQRIIDDATEEKMERLARIPYVLADSRREVQAYLGFRHVSGIKEWNPAEKAEFISHLIDDEGLTYEEVMRRIGSKTPTVRQNYIAYRILLQMEDESEDIAIDKVEDRFSVLYLSLRTEGVRKYLQIDVMADPESAKRPVPQRRIRQLENFARWLFGTEEEPPLVRDSRQTDDFGAILESDEAIKYLERNRRANFESAFRIAGGDETEIVEALLRASDEVESALSTIHLHKRSKKVKDATERLGRGVLQLFEILPDVKETLLEEG
ncbi:MAG: hypothetical protein R3C18_16745 [Planctomycetaceae bacterium]